MTDSYRYPSIALLRVVKRGEEFVGTVSKTLRDCKQISSFMNSQWFTRVDFKEDRSDSDENRSDPIFPSKDT